MSTGYRGIIVAAFGFLTLSGFGLGYYHAALNYPQEPQYQSYRYASDKPSEIDPALIGEADTEALEYREPCQQPKGKDESELCAQWRAAKAGEHSALWAKWGFWIGVIGSSILLYQIGLTRKALEYNGNAIEAMLAANKIARAGLQAQLRPYVHATAVSIRVLDGGYSIGMRFKNTGGQPAIDVKCVAILEWSSVKDATSYEEFSTDKRWKSVNAIPPQQPRDVRLPMNGDEAALTKKDKKKGFAWCVRGSVRWKDINGTCYRTEFVFFARELTDIVKTDKGKAFYVVQTDAPTYQEIDKHGKPVTPDRIS